MSYAPTELKAWIGGYVGPSYEIERSESGVVYRVYERGYDVHHTETIPKNDRSWKRFIEDLEMIGVWGWKPVYQGDSSPDATTWYVHIHADGKTVESKGINLYPPAFTEFLRSMRTLLEGRHFA